MNITLKDDFKESVKIPSPSIIVHPVTKGVLDYHARPQALGIFNMKKKKGIYCIYAHIWYSLYLECLAGKKQGLNNQGNTISYRQNASKRVK